MLNAEGVEVIFRLHLPTAVAPTNLVECARDCDVAVSRSDLLEYEPSQDDPEPPFIPNWESLIVKPALQELLLVFCMRSGCPENLVSDVMSYFNDERSFESNLRYYTSPGPEFTGILPRMLRRPVLLSRLQAATDDVNIRLCLHGGAIKTMKDYLIHYSFSPRTPAQGSKRPAIQKSTLGLETRISSIPHLPPVFQGAKSASTMQAKSAGPQKNRRRASLVRLAIMWFIVVLTFRHLRHFFSTKIDPKVWISFAVGSTPGLPWTTTTHEASRERVVRELESLNTRFYVYDDPKITQANTPTSPAPLFCKRYCHEAETELIIDEVLRKHPLRVKNADDAELFVVPINPGRILTTWGLSWETPFLALTSHPVFQKHHGHKHIMISNALVTYNYPHRRSVWGMLHWLPSVSNVTAAVGIDHIAVWRAYERGEFAGNDYESALSVMRPMSHTSFSIGIGAAERDFPITPASMEKFDKSTYFLFYRTREAPSMNGGTPFRMAPIHNMSLSALPKSSIGFDLPSQQVWTSQFHDAKFCLVIRGDCPQSHALLRSVRAGCIPVVVSDLLPRYSTPLKSSLSIADYSIILREADFMADTEKALRNLIKLPRGFLVEKIANLTLAQRVLLPDHPQSLFVPAFLKESLIAMEDPSPAFF